MHYTRIFLLCHDYNGGKKKSLFKKVVKTYWKISPSQAWDTQTFQIATNPLTTQRTDWIMEGVHKHPQTSQPPQDCTQGLCFMS